MAKTCLYATMTIIYILVCKTEFVQVDLYVSLYRNNVFWNAFEGKSLFLNLWSAECAKDTNFLKIFETECAGLVDFPNTTVA